MATVITRWTAGCSAGKAAKLFLYYPIDARFGKVFADIGNDWKIVQHVAQRRGFNQDDVD